MNKYTIRLATPADAADMLKVYAPYVLTTANTFEYEVPGEEEFRRRIEAVIPGFPWLVCEYDGEIIGYAYAHKHRDRTAYQWSPESTIYIAEAHHGKGLARILYTALFDILRLQGFFNVYAGVLSTNENSCAFHKAMGFEEIGLFRNIGYKLGQWHSNLWLQYFLQEHVDEPALPVSFDKLADTLTVQNILGKAGRKMIEILA
jgi:phosphinothricin acetyltransferase